MKVFKNYRKLLNLFILLLLTFTIAGCSEDIDSQVEISSSSVPFSNCEEDFNVKDVDGVDLYYIDSGVLPYIDLTEYIELIQPMSRITTSDVRVEEDVLRISYNPVPLQYMFYTEDNQGVEDVNYKQTMEINFEEDTVTVSSYLFFMYQGAQMLDSNSDRIDILDASIKQGEEVTIPFGEYDFDFVTYQEEDQIKHLVPFHVATLLFTNSTLYRTYYNGDEIIGGGFCIYEDSIRISSFNGTEVPEEMRMASYNLFTLALDYFSPIKQIREVDSYRNKLISKLVSLKAADMDDYYMQLTDLLYMVDDLHAALAAPGYYSSASFTTITPYPTWNRPIRAHYWEIVSEYGNEFRSIFDETPTVRLFENDTIAVIHIFQFTKSMPQELKAYLDDLPDTVVDVVVDLSMNGGGNVQALFQLLGYMTNQPITFTNGIAIDGSKVTFTVDVDEDAYDYNWYIKTSNYSYSAAHVASLIAKENNIALLIGENTSGGASPIESVLLPCGFSHTISGNYAYYSQTSTSENGVKVDIQMIDIWDDLELIELIKAQEY